jgi:peptidoglycan/LPS O-acetylase OafA/YrhL
LNSSQRVLGWDLLRGSCALAVSTYHLLAWLGIASLYTFGFYGVYLFFVLSGASLAYTYGEKIRLSQFSLGNFLLIRYFRLAPLYVTLMLLALPWKLTKEPVSAEFLFKVLSNSFFLFGLYNPATHSMLVGGWSLGIEAIFYVLFPLMMWSLHVRFAGWLLWTACLCLQAIWIATTVGTEVGDIADTVAYHQVPAFAAYFMGGCLIGWMRGRDERLLSMVFPAGVALVASGFALMFLVNPADAASALTGWRGLLLTSLCFIMVENAGRLKVIGVHTAMLAAWLGNATYGLYLLHPVIFFGLSYIVFPRLGISRPPQEWPLDERWLLIVGIILSSLILALASERYFERPVRTLVYRYVERRRLAKDG